MHVQTDGPEKTNDADVTIVAHAMRVRTTMLSLALIFEFPTFTNHKISITLLILPKCRGQTTPVRLQI